MRTLLALALALVITPMEPTLRAAPTPNEAPLLFDGKTYAEWLRALTHKNAQVREEAVRALGRIGRAQKATIPALCQALQDEDPSVRASAANSLRLLGPMAKPALPALKKVLHDPKASVGVEAARAVWQIARDEAALAALFEICRNKHKQMGTRCLVLGAMRDIGPVGVRPLAKALRDESAELRALAAEALGWIGPAAKCAIPDLKKALKDPSEMVRDRADDALDAIGPP